MSLFGRQGGSVRKPGGALTSLAPGTGSLVVTGLAPTAASTANHAFSMEFTPEFDINSNVTAGGAPVPAGWALQRLDTFGTANSVAGAKRLHSLYYEAIWFGRDSVDRVTIPNTVINNQQQTYQHFEDATFNFMSDRLRIQARGQGDGSIKSGQICSKLSFRSWIVEARITAPAALASWVEFWNFSSSSGAAQEVDTEIVISNPAGTGSNLGVHDVSIGNIPGVTPTIDDPAHVTVGSLLLYSNPSFNVSTGPHFYTMVYDDTGAGEIRRYIDGVLLYHAPGWKWNAGFGGTGFGPDATLIMDLAVGGAFAGSLATPGAYSGDLDIYSIAVYTPGAAGRPVPAGQAWNFNARNAHCTLSNNDLTVTTSTDAIDQACYAFDSVSSGTGAGKYYWEIVANGTPTTPACGIGSYLDPVSDTHWLGELNDNLGWFSTGAVWSNFAQVATWSSFGPGSVRLCFALDMVNLKIWGRVGTTGIWNNAAIGSQNPATNTGGLTLPAPIRFQVVPGVNLHNTGDTATLAATSGSWAGTPPSGFGQI